MNLSTRLLLSLSAGLLMCQCSSTDGEKKEVDRSSMKLEQRAMLKPNENQRSSFEKYLTDPKLAKGSAGMFFQKQTHHSQGFNGAGMYAGQKQFKTNQSLFSKKATGFDMTYALGDKLAGGTKGSFKTDASQFGSQQAREGKSFFSGSDQNFKAGMALPRSKAIGRAPKIIENYNDRGDGKKSAYTEDEVRKLLNRN
ncbi:hypothetical protein [Prosthecobacter sp.]|uniref:hypothetical protein n=1 Tax=Prosthecobacter sp. TaxID=1965333 RepID=UPI003783D27B